MKNKKVNYFQDNAGFNSRDLIESFQKFKPNICYNIPRTSFQNPSEMINKDIKGEARKLIKVLNQKEKLTYLIKCLKNHDNSKCINYIQGTLNRAIKCLNMNNYYEFI